MAGVSHAAKNFTPKQGQYLAFIHLYTRLHRRPPAETDMQQYFRVSPPSVHQMVARLWRGGLPHNRRRPWHSRMRGPRRAAGASREANFNTSDDLAAGEIAAQRHANAAVTSRKTP